MTIIRKLSAWGERLPVPDFVSRLAIASLVRSTDRALVADQGNTEVFARDMADFPIAVHADAANRQHYEVPAQFFAQILGFQLKYSCCYYNNSAETLTIAEQNALKLTARHANISDGQRILELGCGWGSLSLWLAERFPKAQITAVSNSNSQRLFIEQEARRRGISNLKVVTADINNFSPAESFDRVVSVEMFEHIANWRALLGRIRGWLKPDGRLFIHVFAHRQHCYRFDTADTSDWIAQHFFTGGLMPSATLVHQFPDLFTVEAEWRWSGEHYRATAEDWLANFDSNLVQIDPILRAIYGADAPLWRRRWRLFFLATSGLFGHAGGEAWGVHHYRLRAA